MKAVISKGQAMSSDEERFVELYRLYGRQLLAYCRRRTSPSLAADAVSETFLVAWRKLEDVPVGEAALPWLYGVAYRVLSHQWRHLARSRRLIDRLGGLAEFGVPPPDVIVLRDEEHRLILKASSRLRPIDQEVLRLTMWEELSHADVAVVLGIQPDAVKQRAYRARRNLAEEYRKITNSPPLLTKGGEA
jgi:RNA polymerase sigma-70 factor (ECF subfamily)